jgi:hypothetical protein
MAFVVKRSDGRFEIRESLVTPAGPRARTLAPFRVLTDEVIERARSRARRPFDAAKIRRRASELRAPQVQGSVSATTRRLVSDLRHGERPPPALVAALTRVLPPAPAVIAPDSLDGALEWIEADLALRGRTLRDLLELASLLPQRRRGELVFPRLSTAPTP